MFLKVLSYVGCYADTGTRDLPYWPISSSTLTIDACISACCGYLYTAVQAG